MSRILLGILTVFLILGISSHPSWSGMRQLIAGPMTYASQPVLALGSRPGVNRVGAGKSVARQNSRLGMTVADPVSMGIVRPSRVYDTAYQDFVKGRYQLAIQQFEKFLEDFPTNSRAPQAYFYLGECYYNLGDLKNAAEYLSIIITRHRENVPNYQNSRQVPPALFRLGGVYEEAGKTEKARAFWGILLTDHPETPEAQLARKRLQKLP